LTVPGHQRTLVHIEAVFLEAGKPWGTTSTQEKPR
jgi:hypothetical protein